jgi:hypothetical protein
MTRNSFNDFVRLISTVLVISLLVFLVYYFVAKDAPASLGTDKEAGILEKLTPKTAVSIVMVLVGLLAWMFWLTISFGRRLSERSYLGPLTKDALARAEINRREDDLRENLRTGVFASAIKLDDNFRAKWRIPREALAPNLTPGVSIDELGRPNAFTTSPWDYGDPYGTGSGTGTGTGGWEDPKPSLEGFSAEDLTAAIAKIGGPDKPKYSLWEITNEINRRFTVGFQREQIDYYYGERVKIRSNAQDYAERLLPGIDVSAFGGGWIFVLEFTTIIFIIFAALALGFVGVLGSEQIGTILAAIAGYVLGKSSTFKSPEGGEIVRGAEQPTAVLDLLAKQSETRSKTNDEKKALEAKISQLEKDLSSVQIMVPNVIGRSVLEAEKALKEKGLLAFVPASQPKEGQVIDQIPAEKETAAKGSLVTLLVVKAAAVEPQPPASAQPPAVNQPVPPVETPVPQPPVVEPAPEPPSGAPFQPPAADNFAGRDDEMEGPGPVG